MTLDEAIKHAEEVTEEKLNNAVYIMDKMKSDVALKNAEECKQCAEEHSQLAEWLTELKQLREQTRWIPCSERMPKEKINPITQDFYEYQCTYHAYGIYDVRSYKYGNGHWWHGAGIMDDSVIAWRENPEPYKAESEDNE